MKSLSHVNGAWVLTIILGLTGASYTTQVTTDLRPPAPDSRPLTSKEPDATTKAKIQAAYGKLPLSFEANQGQTDTQVKYLSRGPGYTLLLTSTEAVLALRKPARRDTETRRRGDIRPPIPSPQCGGGPR